ncbi:receptor protein kinase isoform X1 [Spatholobus suberectus]|nr:receptor protein kinase isoform X1 [Spatholobus suberectus]
MKMKLLVMLLILLLHQPIWVHVAADPPASSPQLPSAFSPGIKAGKEQHHLHKKVVIALVVAATALGALIFSFLCIWIYRTKYPTKSKTKNVETPDTEKGVALAPF